MVPRERSDFHADAPASCKDIMDYVWEKYGVRVFNSYIAHVKKQCGLRIKAHSRRTAEEHPRWDYCPPDKAEYIKEALEHFGFFGQDVQ